MNLVLLPCSESAKPFVADSFVRSYQGGDTPLAKVEAGPRARALRAWLDERWSSVRVMIGEGDCDVFLGWLMLADGDAAWYVYVKHDIRRQGLAREALRMAKRERVLLTTREWQCDWRA